MADADLDLLELLLRYVALPVIIGMFTIGAIALYDSRTTRRVDEKENRKEQMQGARETMKNVMADAERLSSLMRYHAWGVAWRKMRPEGIFSEDLVEEDEKKWVLFDDALTQWRRNKITYNREIDVYFGKRAAASRLFKLVDATIDKLSFELWFIYHDNPSNPNVFLESFVEDIGQPYDTVFNAIMTAIDKKITREQEENVHRITSSAFDELQDKVSRLCFEMSEAIRIENVGNLRINNKIEMRKLHKKQASKKEMIESSLGST
jgi:hypothetical protein